jgi:hypothetical protein
MLYGERDYEVGILKITDGGEYKLGLKGLQGHFKIRVMNRQIIPI